MNIKDDAALGFNQKIFEFCQSRTQLGKTDLKTIFQEGKALCDKAPHKMDGRHQDFTDADKPRFNDTEHTLLGGLGHKAIGRFQARKNKISEIGYDRDHACDHGGDAENAAQCRAEGRRDGAGDG